MFRPILIALALAAFLPIDDAKANDPIPAAVKQSINKCLIGEFDIVMTLGDEKSTGSYTATWMPGQTCVRLEATHNTPNGVEYSNAVLGWHADSNTLVQHGFDSQGYWTIKYTDVRPTEWVGTWKGYLNGETQESKSVFKATDTGWEYRDTTNGMDFVYVAKRKGPANDGNAAFQSLAKLAVGGVWTRTDDEQYKHSYEWAIEGKFVHRTAKGGLLPNVTMIGVDPKTQQCVWWFYNQDGSVGTSVCKLEKEGVWSFEGTSEGSNGMTSYKGRAIRVDDNTIREEIVQSIVNGEKQETGSFTWKR